MKEEMMEFIRGKDICVLCTASQSGPWCSMMSYVAGPSGDRIYTATRRGSRKHQNIQTNPIVSVLIDDREERTGEDRSRIRAMTASGQAAEVADKTERERILGELAARHPQLKELLADDATALLEVRFNSLLLLRGVSDSIYIELD